MMTPMSTARPAAAHQLVAALSKYDLGSIVTALSSVFYLRLEVVSFVLERCLTT